MSVRVVHDLRIEAGFATQKGRRPDNQDYVAFCLGPGGAGALQGVVAAVADGVGGHKGGRAAAETAVRAFIDGYYAQPETLGVSRAAARSLEAANSWIAAQSRVDPSVGRHGDDVQRAHPVAPNGLYPPRRRYARLSPRWRQPRTTDERSHRRSRRFRPCAPSRRRLRRCALFDQGMHSLNVHDRFLLCSDGVHGVLRRRDASCAARRKGRAAGNVGEDCSDGARRRAATTMSLRLSLTSSMCRPPTSAPCRAPSQPCRLASCRRSEILSTIFELTAFSPKGATVG